MLFAELRDTQESEVVPAWEQVTDFLLSCGEGPSMLKDVMKTRRRFIRLGLNGRNYAVERAVMRDYLKQKLSIN